VSSHEPRPLGFNPVRSYFDSAEGVWRDPEAEAIPFGEDPVHVDMTGIADELAERARYDQERRGGRLQEPEPEPLPELELVTVEDFVAVEEQGAAALVGDAEGALIPEGGDTMFYGDGGAGKTTLAIDLGCHLAAGKDWLGLPIGQAVRVLLIENEGPRPLFRAKLRRKLDGWRGPLLRDRLVVLEQPWARLSFAEASWRDALAETVRAAEVDVLIVGPVSRSGMNEAGTLQEVRDFMALVDEVRERSGRRLAVVLIHHENKGGSISGAWEGAGDTLLHVTGQGQGRTRLYVQKARWSSAHHATTLQLLWAEAEGFEVEELPELDDETIAAQLLAAIRGNPGTGWTRVEEATPGVSRERRREIRDGLLVRGEIVNLGKDENGEPVLLDHCPERKAARLYPPDDPTIAHLRPSRGADGAQTVTELPF
jgi:hypothetical protein